MAIINNRGRLQGSPSTDLLLNLKLKLLHKHSKIIRYLNDQ